MKKLWFRKFLLVFLIVSFCVFFLSNSIQSFTYLASGSDFQLMFSEGQGFRFQSGSKTIVLTVTVGNLISNESDFYMNDGGGQLNFKANESVTMQITFNHSNVRVKGDKGNELRAINSGASIPIDKDNVVYIQWSYGAILLLPIKFIFGMVGLASMAGGAIYAVQQIKHKEYYEGLRNGAIFLSIGFALFITWLW
jgi:hypothetical protein